MLKRSLTLAIAHAAFCFFLLACGDGESASETFGQSSSTKVKAERLNSCYKGDAWECEVESEIVRLVNDMRRQKLEQSFEASFVARRWSDDQASVAEISHDGFPDARHQTLRQEFPGFSISFRAENVAMIYAPDAEARKVAKTFVKNWYDSIGHRENMLGPYRTIGVGVTRRGGYVYGTQIFY